MVLFALNPWLIPTENCLCCLLLTNAVSVILSHTLCITECLPTQQLNIKLGFQDRALINMSRETALLGYSRAWCAGSQLLAPQQCLAIPAILAQRWSCGVWQLNICMCLCIKTHSREKPGEKFLLRLICFYIWKAAIFKLQDCRGEGISLQRGIFPSKPYSGRRDYSPMRWLQVLGTELQW